MNTPPVPPPPCVCGEPEPVHDIRRDGSRGKCSASKGPRATPCGCEAYTPALAEQGSLFEIETPVAPPLRVASHPG